MLDYADRHVFPISISICYFNKVGEAQRAPDSVPTILRRSFFRCFNYNYYYNYYFHFVFDIGLDECQLRKQFVAFETCHRIHPYAYWCLRRFGRTRTSTNEPSMYVYMALPIPFPIQMHGLALWDNSHMDHCVDLKFKNSRCLSLSLPNRC